MRDHTIDWTPEEREAAQREFRDITSVMREHGPQMKVTPNRDARRAKSKQQRASRKANRR